MDNSTKKAKIIGRVRRQQQNIRNSSQQAAVKFKSIKERAVRFLKKKGKNNWNILLSEQHLI